MNKLIFILLLFVSSICAGQSSFFWSHNFIDSNVIKYGYLYNGYVALDPNITSDDNWTVPDNVRWYDLFYTIDGEPDESNQWTINVINKLQETGDTYWDPLNEDATNELHFNARGSGARFYDDIDLYFIALKYGSIWWNTYSDTTFENTISRTIFIPADGEVAYEGQVKYVNGYSIRLCRSATPSELLLTDGTYCDDYVGNDGKIYATVKIGNLVWITSDLAETKYRGGSIIQTVTDGATWLGLTTGAKCAYDNDETNSVE